MSWRNLLKYCPKQSSEMADLTVLVNGLQRRMDRMTQEVSDLNAAVAGLTTAVNGAVTALGSVNGINPDAADVEAAVQTINGLATSLNNAVAAIPVNPTPVTPAPTPVPGVAAAAVGGPGA